MAPPIEHAAEFPPFLTVAQVQELTQLGRGQVYRLVERYESSGGTEGIPAVRFGRCLRVPRDELFRVTGLGSDLTVTK